MLITNLLLGIIIFFMIIIYGGLCTMNTILNGLVISNAESLRLKRLSDNLMKRKGKETNDYPVGEE